MKYDKPVVIERQDEETERWQPVGPALHARVNKHIGTTTDRAGADQYHLRLRFTLRYVPVLAAIQYAPQLYRILYRGQQFKIIDYDDYMEEHKEITLTGKLYE